MPSDEAAARLAGSSSSLIGFKDITSVGSSSGQQQRPHMTAPGPTGDEGLLIPPQDTLYLESDTASSLERVSTVRRSPLPLSGAAQPKTTLVSGEPDRARDAVRSDQMEKTDAAAARSSISPSPSLSGSSASYRRSQSLTQGRVQGQEKTKEVRLDLFVISFLFLGCQILLPLHEDASSLPRPVLPRLPTANGRAVYRSRRVRALTRQPPQSLSWRVEALKGTWT
ncbi:unnamed protein product [Dibothriocephalus latus]|uniref:Uncharacterized protein n=1 Tax=Dibothriocephalus latus TaxID=60516 RepID=A0A3P7KYR9_DIBLA|nr:unnamed protein product [Dibothriocephalus latus]